MQGHSTQQTQRTDAETPFQGTIVVFGGAGFIGTHLLSRLEAMGVGKLVSVDIRSPQRPVAGVEYLHFDVRDLQEFNIKEKVTLVINLAAVHTTPGHPHWEYYDTNVHGAVEVMRFVRRHGTKHVVFTSSISVYGADEREKDETTPPSPTSDYGRSKLMAEKISLDWQTEDPSHHLVTLRPAVVFGLGEGGNFTRLAKMLEKGMFFYPGRRDTIKSCIYVGDLIEWLLAAVQQPEKRVLLNAAYSNRYTIEEIVNAFRAIAFPHAVTKTVPALALKTAATVLRPVSALGLGIHPDRIEKLMKSTNILPRWAEAAGLPTHDRLEMGLISWKAQGGGKFL